MRAQVVSVVLCVVLFWSEGCNRNAPAPPVENTERYISVPNAVPFEIEPLRSTDGSAIWLASYTSQGKTARFELVFTPPRALEDKESREFDVKTGKGKFVAQPGSDASVLLVDLQKALEAKRLPERTQKVSVLPFAYVSFGEKQSQAANGGFSTTPPGNWMPIKIFIGEGNNEGQVFVNLNPVMKKGQFSIKDAEYGDIVLGQLATVL